MSGCRTTPYNLTRSQGFPRHISRLRGLEEKRTALSDTTTHAVENQISIVCVMFHCQLSAQMMSKCAHLEPKALNHRLHYRRPEYREDAPEDVVSFRHPVSFLSPILLSERDTAGSLHFLKQGLQGNLICMCDIIGDGIE